MKKTTTLFILIILFITGLYANPKIPFESLSDDEVDPYIYMNSDGLYSYKIKAVVLPSEKVSLSFIKFFLSTKNNISITITFDNESVYNRFSKDFDLSEIENEFDNLQKKIIKSGISPHLAQVIDESSNAFIKPTTSKVDPTKPYNTWYNCYCSQELQLSDIKK